MFTTSPCPQVLHPCHRCSLCSSLVELSSELLILSPWPVSPGVFWMPRQEKILYFSPTRRRFLPGSEKSHCLPSLCQQRFCTWAWQPEQQVMPKQFWSLHLKKTPNNQRTILLHWEQWPKLDSHYSQSSWALATQKLLAFRGVKLPSSF